MITQRTNGTLTRILLAVRRRHTPANLLFTRHEESWSTVSAHESEQRATLKSEKPDDAMDERG